MMLGEQPIYWHAGLYLQPQHFQLQDLHHEWLQGRYHSNCMPFPWGIITSTIDPHVLENAVVKIERLRCVLPSGIYLEFPGNARVTSRDLFEQMKGRDTPLTLWLGVKRLDTINANVAPDNPEAKPALTRWVHGCDELTLRDIYSHAPDTSLLTLQYNVRLFTEDEKKLAPEYECIPLLRLIADKGSTTVDPDFAPPILCLYGAPAVMREMTHLCELLMRRVRELENYRRQPAINRNLVLRGDEMTQRMALQILCGALPLLQHTVRTAGVHPWFVWGLLAQLTGSLSVLQTRYDWQGQPVNQESHEHSGIGYDHLQPLAGFRHFHKAIQAILDALVLEDNVTLTFDRESNNLFCCALPAGKYEQAEQVFLFISSTALATMPLNECDVSGIRFASRTYMDSIITHALPGLTLTCCELTPPGVPHRQDGRYFSVKQEGLLWDSVKSSHTLALYWSEPLDDMHVQVIFVMPS